MTENPVKYLLREYDSRRLQPLFADINGAKLLVPASYAAEATSDKEALDNFKADFFDHYDHAIFKTIGDYEARAEQPQFVRFDNVELPVPYALKNLAPEIQKQRIFKNAFSRYVDCIRLTAELCRRTGKRIPIRIGKENHEKLINFAARHDKPAATKTEIAEKIRRYRNKLLFGALIAGATLTGVSLLNKQEKQKQKGQTERRNLSPEQRQKLLQERFERLSAEVLKEEGGYATALQIDQETNYGITKQTLTSFREKFPEQAEKLTTTNLKKLKKSDALLIMEHAFFKQYKIDQIENESLALLLLDIAYNHDYETMRRFTKTGLVNVMKRRGENPEERPRNWKDIPEFLNGCSLEEQKIFYDATVKARIDFLEQPGYIKKYNGLKKRAYKFIGGYKSLKPDTEKSIMWAEAVSNRGERL